MWGALDTKPPSGPNTAQEKSRRSLMLVEMEVLWRTLPICSVDKEKWNPTEQDKSPAFVCCVLPKTTFHSVIMLSSVGVPAMLMKRWEKMESCTVLSSVPTAQ